MKGKNPPGARKLASVCFAVISEAWWEIPLLIPCICGSGNRIRTLWLVIGTGAAGAVSARASSWSVADVPLRWNATCEIYTLSFLGYYRPGMQGRILNFSSVLFRNTTKSPFWSYFSLAGTKPVVPDHSAIFFSPAVPINCTYFSDDIYGWINHHYTFYV